MEIAVYHPDGSLRLRGPVLAITQRGEALRDAGWALEGLELVIHPALYEGVRRSDGSIGRLWAPAPAELATIDHARFPYALALGLILPIRWRWDAADGRDCLTLTGGKLLDTAGIVQSEHDPGRAWTALERNLAELQLSERTVRNAEASPDASLGRSIRSGLERRDPRGIQADSPPLPASRADRQESGRPRG